MTPWSTTAAASAMGRAERANCSTRRIDRPPEASSRHLLVELADHERGQAERELVEEEELRVGGEGPGQGEHLLLPARERARQLLAPVGQTWELREGHVFDVVHGHADLRRHEEVLADGQVGEDPAALGHGADALPRPGVRRELVDRGAGEAHLAAARGEGPGADVEDRRLAAAVGTEQGDHGTFRDLQAHPVHHLDRSVAGADVAELEDGRDRVHETTPRYAFTTTGSFLTCSGVPLAMISP